MCIDQKRKACETNPWIERLTLLTNSPHSFNPNLVCNIAISHTAQVISVILEGNQDQVPMQLIL